MNHLPGRVWQTGPRRNQLDAAPLDAPPCASRAPRGLLLPRPGRSSVLYEAGTSRASATCRPLMGPGETKQTQRGGWEGATVRPRDVNRWAGTRGAGSTCAGQTKKRGNNGPESPGLCLGQPDRCRRCRENRRLEVASSRAQVRVGLDERTGRRPRVDVRKLETMIQDPGCSLFNSLC